MKQQWPQWMDLLGVLSSFHFCSLKTTPVCKWKTKPWWASEELVLILAHQTHLTSLISDRSLTKKIFFFQPLHRGASLQMQECFFYCCFTESSTQLWYLAGLWLLVFGFSDFPPTHCIILATGSFTGLKVCQDSENLCCWKH